MVERVSPLQAATAVAADARASAVSARGERKVASQLVVGAGAAPRRLEYVTLQEQRFAPDLIESIVSFHRQFASLLLHIPGRA